MARRAACSPALRWQRFAGVFCWALCIVVPCAAEQPSIWERAKAPGLYEEREVRRATERVLSGTGDERDMLRARAALVSLSRGTVQSPILVLLLIRLRRELRLSPARNTATLLRVVASQDLAPLVRSSLHLELSYFHLARERPSWAERELGTALRYCWEQESRAKLLALRGYVRLADRRVDQAQQDFQLVAKMRSERRTEVQALVGLSLAYALQGRKAELNALSMQAYALQRSRASASGAGLFWDSWAREQLERAADLVLRWGQARSFSSDDPERAQSLLHDICEDLRQDPKTSGLTVQLKRLWSSDCEELQLFEPPLSDQEKRR